MGVWDRNTKWRQGSVVPTDLARRLGVVPDTADRHCVVVVTHDCDLLQSAEVEPTVEVICGEYIAATDGQFTFGKTARTLHLEFQGDQGVRTAVALSAPRKARVPKVSEDDVSLSDGEPVPHVALPTKSRNHLREWLASRYNRHALPDEFERRLGTTGVRERLLKVLAAHGQWIAAVYLEIDDGEPREHDGADDPFEVSVYLVYDSSRDMAAAQKAAEDTKKRIEEIFTQRCHQGDRKNPARWLSLTAVEVFSAGAMSMALAQDLTRWRLDYLSYRADPEQPVIRE